MKFVLLGSGPGKPSLDKHLSALYVESGGVKLLFDCGDGTYRRLMEHGYNGDVLDAIIISHYHPDHICGIFMVLQMFYLEHRTKPLHLFLPERPAAFLETMHMFYTFEQKFPYELMIHMVDETELYFPMVNPVLSDHLTGYEAIIKSLQIPNTMQSFSFFVEGENGNLLYTSDLQSADNVLGLLQNCHTIIIDAIHPEAHTVLMMEQYPISRILLNHGISAELEAWLNEHPNPRFEFASEDIEYTI